MQFVVVYLYVYTRINSRVNRVKDTSSKESKVVNGSWNVNLLCQPDRLSLVLRLSLCKHIQSLLYQVCYLEQN